MLGGLLSDEGRAAMKTAEVTLTAGERRRIGAKIDRISSRLDHLEGSMAGSNPDVPKAKRELERLKTRMAAIHEELESAR